MDPACNLRATCPCNKSDRQTGTTAVVSYGRCHIAAASSVSRIEPVSPLMIFKVCLAYLELRRAVCGGIWARDSMDSGVALARRKRHPYEATTY